MSLDNPELYVRCKTVCEKLKSLIGEWAEDIEKLNARINIAATRAKGEYEKQMRELQLNIRI